MSLSTLYSMPPTLCDELSKICRKALTDVVEDGVEGASKPFDAGALDPVVP